MKGHNALIPDEFLGQIRVNLDDRNVAGAKRSYKLTGVKRGAVELSVIEQ